MMQGLSEDTYILAVWSLCKQVPGYKYMHRSLKKRCMLCNEIHMYSKHYWIQWHNSHLRPTCGQCSNGCNYIFYSYLDNDGVKHPIHVESVTKSGGRGDYMRHIFSFKQFDSLQTGRYQWRNTKTPSFAQPIVCINCIPVIALNWN